MELFPVEIIAALCVNLEIRDLLALASLNTSLRKVFFDNQVNIQLANHFGFFYEMNIFTVKDYFGISPRNRLYDAAMIGNTRIVSFLLGNYIYENNIYLSAGCLAASRGQMEILELLLKYISLNCPDSKKKLNYNTLLISATEGGQMEIIQFMMNLGANDYNNSMNKAALKGQINVVKFMIEKGAKSYNESMLNAITQGHTEIIKLMFKFGAIICDRAIIDIVVKERKEMLVLILELVDTINKINVCNKAMIVAAVRNNIEIVELAIEYGAENYNEVMEIASSKGYFKIVKLMIECGAITVNYSMECAASKGYKEIVEFLIEKGADNYFDCAKIAEKNGFYDLAKLIRERGKEWLYK